MSLSERAHGDIAPVAVTKKNTTAHGKDLDGAPKAEKNQMLACLFMDGASKIFGCLVKSMSNDHALGTEKCLEDMETALQIMMLFQEGA